MPIESRSIGQLTGAQYRSVPIKIETQTIIWAQLLLGIPAQSRWDWTVGDRAAMLNKANGRIAYRFHARDLNLVMAPAARGASVRFRVLIDGQPPGAAHGVDADEQGNGTATEQRTYQLIRQAKPIADRQFEIEFLDPGVGAFDFTFG